MWSVQRVAVSSTDWLDGGRGVRNNLSNPRLFNRRTPSVPANGKVSDLQHRAIQLHCLFQRNDFGIFCSRLAAEKLPTIIIGVVCDTKNRLLALQHLARSKHSAVTRLIEWPWLRAYHLTTTS